MELCNINNKVRESITNYIDKYMLKGFSLEESIESFKDLIYENEEVDPFGLDVGVQLILKIIFADAVKLYLYKMKNGIIKEKEMIKFNILKDINDYNDLNAEISVDSDLLSSLIMSSYEFLKTNDLGKILILKSLSPNQNTWIQQIHSTHIMDLMCYTSEISLNDIVKIYTKKISEQKMYYISDCSDINVTTIIGFLQNFAKYGTDNSIKLLCDVGIVDYSVCKYLSLKNIANDFVIDHIDYYENYSLKDILDRLLFDETFLNCAVWQVYSLYFDNCYEDIPLDENILNTEDVKKMKRKLVLR